jgi:PAS domain S-box-containing protein
MTDTSTRWRATLMLAGVAWVVTFAILVVNIVRVQLSAPDSLSASTLVLTTVGALVAVAATARAVRALRSQQRVERDLHRAQQTFEGILTIAADGIISVDESMRIVHFNHGAEVIFGWPADEVRGRPIDVLMPERFRVVHHEHMRAFGQGTTIARRMGERRSIFGLRRDGSEFPAEASISKLDTDDTRLFTVVLRDITSRVRTEANQRFLAAAGGDLAASLDYEQTLIAAVHAAVPYVGDCAIVDLVDAPGDVRRVVSVHDDVEKTRALRRLAGRWAGDTDWPLPIATVLSTGQRVLRSNLPAGWADAPPAGHQASRDLSALGIHGLVSVPLRSRGQTMGAFTLCLTEPGRHCGEEECELVEQLAERISAAIDHARLYREARRATQARDELQGVVSHDLRNPLSAISMCARVLAEQPPEHPAERTQIATTILDSVAAMQRLIQDLLDAATVETGQLRIAPEELEITVIIDRAVRMVQEPADHRGVRLIRDTVPGLPRVFADSLRIEQVLANLLGNAIKFTERGGQVTVAAAVDGVGVRLSVADTGVGIPAEALPHIFDRYWHARRNSRTAGTGLGLAIAKGIVAAHGSVLQVQSTVGKGSVFAFTLPLVDGDGTARTAESSPVSH